MSPRPKRWVTRLETCRHGGIDHAELSGLGLKPDDIIDFSVSTNPFMPPPGLKESLAAVPVERYPDSQSTELRAQLAADLDVPIDNILAGNGTTELIRLIAAVYFRRGDRVLIPEPVYGEYETDCRIAGTRTIGLRAYEKDGFVPKVNDIIDAIRQHHPRAIFICNPNNPTGHYLPRRVIEDIADAAGDGLLVLDEAYVAFVEESWDSLDLLSRDNVVVMRSMTKDYGLPGLRLGYAVARIDIIDNLRRVTPPWNVNAVAQHAGIAVLKQREYLRQSLAQVREASRYLWEGIAELGLPVLPSDATYFLVKVGDAAGFHDALAAKGLLVRDCSSFGLPEHVRIAPRTPPECRKLIDAIGSLMATGESFISRERRKRI